MKIKKLEEKSNHLERRYSVVNNDDYDDDEENEHDILLATSLPLVDENGLIVIENKLLTDKTFKSYLVRINIFKYPYLFYFYIYIFSFL